MFVVSDVHKHAERSMLDDESAHGLTPVHESERSARPHLRLDRQAADRAERRRSLVVGGCETASQGIRAR
jgi:hypothetical protein